MIPQGIFVNVLMALTLATLLAILIVVVLEAYLHYKEKRRKPVSASEVLYSHIVKMDEKTFRNLRDGGIVMKTYEVTMTFKHKNNLSIKGLINSIRTRLFCSQLKVSSFIVDGEEIGENKMITKNQKYFNHAFEEWSGKMWEWTINGKPNHPMDSKDKEVIAFYLGFRAAKKGQDAVLGMFRSLKSIQKDFDSLKNELDKFKKKEKGLL